MPLSGPESVFTIDCQYFGPERAAAYLVVENGRAAFIDNNTSHAVPHMMAALEAKDAEAGDVALRTYCSVLDKAAKGGVIKKNTAIRRKTNAANGLRKIAS